MVTEGIRVFLGRKSKAGEKREEDEETEESTKIVAEMCRLPVLRSAQSMPSRFMLGMVVFLSVKSSSLS
ncbi:unnamed protein product [Allacma fusca]|uniref:Uncharacterized protein n=1 Tax=Allacma fusca TaxID=39272 RepID=A0A8J2K760_9HEXA|nr:unnamed protein product [Allacma fusca]